MAYFSNSSEGEVLDELCCKCIHGYDATKGENRNERNEPCSVWLLQQMWNYSQHETEDRGRIIKKFGNTTLNIPVGALTNMALVKKQALDILLPQDNKVLCSMFKPINENESRSSGGG